MQEAMSIVIPVYNRAAVLRRVFDSVWAQTYRPLHLILVDNGSSDDSLPLCTRLKSEFESDDFKISVLQEPRRGANAARNRGLEQVESVYVMFFDTDDVLDSRAVELYMREFCRDGSADMVASTVSCVDAAGKESLKKVVFTDRVEQEIFHSILYTGNFAVRTELIRRIGAWDEELFRWQDWNLAIRLLLERPALVWIKKPRLVRKMFTADSITGETYSAGLWAIADSVAHTRLAVRRSSFPQKERLDKLLLYKQMVVAGLCAREGSADAAELYRRTMEESAGDRTLRWFLPAVYRYVSCGGRGSSHLASWLLR